jgi:hypothetical protein
MLINCIDINTGCIIIVNIKASITLSERRYYNLNNYNILWLIYFNN